VADITTTSDNGDYVNIEGEMGIIRSHIRQLSRITGEKVPPWERKNGV
jgi:hypothetical protein